MDNKQLAHLWANQSRPSGKGSSFYFEGATIYSYGPHFPIARHYKGAVLFTRDGYSVTTARHISLARMACSHLDAFSVVNPRNDPSGKDVAAYGEAISAAKLKAAKARNPEFWLGQVESLVAEANSFCSRFGFKTRFELAGEAELSALKERAREASKREAKARKARAAKLELENAVAVEEWQAGKRDSLPHGIAKVYLRSRQVAEHGTPTGHMVVQTSKGAIVPFGEAEKAFRFITLHREQGWHRNGNQFAIGKFQLDAVNQDGIVAGCHRITWDVIDAFAKSQGWA